MMVLSVAFWRLAIMVNFDDFCAKYRADNSGADDLTCALNYLVACVNILGREYDVIDSVFYERGRKVIFDFIHDRERFNASMVKRGFCRLHG